MPGYALLWFIINHTIHISDCCQFSDIHISQGSVATYLRYDGIVKYEFVANLPVSLPVKEFWKSVNIWGSYGQEFSVLFFWDTVYVWTMRPKQWPVELSSSNEKVRRRYRLLWRRIGDGDGCNFTYFTLNSVSVAPTSLPLNLGPSSHRIASR